MTALLCALVSIAGAAARLADPIAVEKRIGQFQLQYDARVKSQDWTGAMESIRQAASLDPDHPRPYLMVVLMQGRRGAREAAGAIMDGLGPPGGPGRTYGEGIALFMAEKTTDAAESLRRALAMYHDRNHAAGQAACHTALGNVDRQAGRLDEAMTHYEAARPFLEQIEDRLGTADILSNLAKLDRQSGNPERAAARQREVLAIREALGDEPGQSRSWHEIGVSLLQAGDHEGALKALDHALAMRRAAGDKASEATTLQVIGEARLAASKDRDGLAAFQAASSIYESSGDRQGLTATRAWVGRSLRRLGEFESARNTLESALAGAVDLKDAKLQASILTDLGAVHAALWEVGDALIAASRALDLNREQKNKRGEMTNLNTLCWIYFNLGQPETARRHVDSALRIARDLDDEAALAREHNNRGVLLAQAGDLDAGLKALQEAERLWRRLGDARGEASSQANMAEILVAQRHISEAEQRLASAREAFRASGDRPGQVSAANQAASLTLKAGRAEAAATMFREALESARRSGLAEEEWRARAGLAEAYEALHRHNAAIEQSLAALDRIEKVRSRLPGDILKIRFLAGRIGLYEQALSLMLTGGDHDKGDRAAETLGIVERARARSLADLLAESRAGLRESVPADLRRSEEQALDAIGAGTVSLLSADGAAEEERSLTELNLAEERMQLLEAGIRKEVPRYAEMVYPRPSTAAAVQRQLAKDEVLLEYFIGARSAWLWEISRDGVSVATLAPPGRIREAVSTFRDRSSSAGAALSSKAPRAAADGLTDMLLPQAARLRGKRLIIVPDGPLHHVPFEALVHKGRFLIEDHEISVVPSSTTLLLMRSQASSRAGITFLGVGDPVPGGGDDLVLPYSRIELEKIAGLFEEPARTLLTGRSATRTALKSLDLTRYRFVHFATHGLLKEGERRTGMWLGATTKDGSDSVLTLDDVLSMRMDANLVVLSACRSGLGELIDGEGLISLTRAFLYAGSRSVVVALWDVNDASTVDFMKVFYGGLRSGDAPAAALRKAKLSFIRSDRAPRREPYRWAPFILVGAPPS